MFKVKMVATGSRYFNKNWYYTVWPCMNQMKLGRQEHLKYQSDKSIFYQYNLPYYLSYLTMIDVIKRFYC